VDDWPVTRRAWQFNVFEWRYHSDVCWTDEGLDAKDGVVILINRDDIHWIELGVYAVTSSMR